MYVFVKLRSKFLSSSCRCNKYKNRATDFSPHFTILDRRQVAAEINLQLSTYITPNDKKTLTVDIFIANEKTKKFNCLILDFSLYCTAAARSRWIRK